MTDPIKLADHRRPLDPVPDAGSHWLDGLMKKGHEGTILGDERNVLRALRTAAGLKGLVRFNEFARTIELTRPPPWRHADPGTPWTDNDDTELAAFLQRCRIRVRSRSLVADCVAVAAKDNCVHPVRQYLTSVEWDGSERLDWWLEIYLVERLFSARSGH